MPRPTSKAALSLLCLAALAGCRQEMAHGPRYDTFEKSPFFADNNSARPLPPGTVARGQLRTDPTFFEGRAEKSLDATRRFLAGTPFALPAFDFTDELPIVVDRGLLDRGRERFGIWCAVCHGTTAEGNGVVVKRGYLKPPSLHIARLRDAPVGYLFHVVTNGHGGMPSYSAEIPVPDRWAIVAYARVLQLSHGVPVGELDEEDRRKLQGGSR
jgi:mono/diheme cytochrome c family protein